LTHHIKSFTVYYLHCETEGVHGRALDNWQIKDKHLSLDLRILLEESKYV
jgi:hypothetical protein